MGIADSFRQLAGRALARTRTGRALARTRTGRAGGGRAFAGWARAKPPADDAGVSSAKYDNAAGDRFGRVDRAREAVNERADDFTGRRRPRPDC